MACTISAISDQTPCHHPDFEIKEFAALLRNGNVYHYNSEYPITAKQNQAIGYFLEYFKKQSSELLQSGVPLISSREHKTVIYANRATE